MNKYYKELNDYIFSKLSKDEILKTGMWGENSQFIRMNNSKVRQTGVIDDMSYSISLISNNRQTSTSQTITGDLITDKKRLIDDIESSLPGIMKSTPSKELLLSTIAITGILSLFASCIAILS